MARLAAPLKVRQEYADCREIPLRYRGQYLRATEGQSPTTAIRALCMECQGYDFDAVATCDLEGCPLWAFRPRRASPPYLGPTLGEIVPSSTPEPQNLAPCGKDSRIEG
jgi:hypothetical protein